MEKTEILAPAGNLKNFYVAINNGADAVYLGLQGFNARAKAENFTKENIREITSYAHLFGVKVYVTLNTLISNDEAQSLLETAKACVDAKVDAFLVQDFGVLSLLKQNFKGINIHASTQMGIHNLEGAIIAEKLGITRVVLSREAKLEDIKLIKKNTNLEIEYFVQGALCVAFSGNCYLSEYLMGESGNRGKCKQICRFSYYNNLTKKEGFYLSPSDLCLLKNLKLLIDAGVCSFKIEGRLRRSGYVGQAVSSYKQALKLLEENKLDETFINTQQEKLKKVFSRGSFNQDAYLFGGVPSNVINTKYNNHTGVKIGKVVGVLPFKNGLKQIVIESTKPLVLNDGLKFFDDDKEVGSLGVGNVENLGDNKYKIYSSQFVKPNWQVNLICDITFEQEFEQKQRKLGLDIFVYAKQNCPLKIKMKCGDVECEVTSQANLEKAKTAAVTQEEIKQQCSKVGDTFVIKNINVCCDDVFIAKSVLNGLRREAVNLITQKIIEKNEKHVNVIFLNKKIEIAKITPQKYKNIVIFSDISQINNIDNQNLYIYAPQIYNQENINTTSKNFKNFGLFLPVVCNYKDMEVLKSIINSNKNMVLYVNNIYGFFFNTSHKIIAGTGMNITNNYASQFLKDLGAEQQVLSFEQNPKNICGDFYIYNSKPALMTFCHCPYKTTFKNECENCRFNGKLTLSTNGHEFKIRRYKIVDCHFELIADKSITSPAKFVCQDLR